MKKSTAGPHFALWGALCSAVFTLSGCDLITKGSAQTSVVKSARSSSSEGKVPILHIVHSLYQMSSEAPHYSVEVHSDGTVIFRGYRAVKVIGADKHELSAKQFNALIHSIRAFDLPRIKPPTHAGVPTYHFPAIVYSSIDGVDGRLYVDRSNVDLYVALRNALEDYLQTLRYRCPIEQSVRIIEDKKVDVCAKVVEFDGLFK